jgi:hypothetical protein
LAKLIFGSFGHHHDGHKEKKKKESKFEKDIERKIEKFFEEGNEGLWCPGGDYKNWRHYHKYWKAEGKAAFEDFLQRMEEKEDSKNVTPQPENEYKKDDE